MKILSILFILIFSLSAFAQTKKTKDYIQVSITDNDATSELLRMPAGMSPNLTDAAIGIKYFGVKSENDISFILFLKGSKSRYSTGESFGVQLSTDNLPLNSNKYRSIDKVAKEAGEEILHFYLTTEDLAWLGTGEDLKITIFNADTGAKLDRISLTPTGFIEFKRFVKSVYLIRSKLR